MAKCLEVRTLQKEIEVSDQIQSGTTSARYSRTNKIYLFPTRLSLMRTFVLMYLVYEDELKKGPDNYIHYNEESLGKRYRMAYRSGFRLPLIEHSQDA